MISCKGDITLWRYLRSVSPLDLERVVGFHPGRLAQGFQIVVLGSGQIIAPNDIELGASTRWSNSEIVLASGKVSRPERLFEERGQDVMALRAKVAAFMNLGGDNAPAKVVPFLKHRDGMEYPDAEALGFGRSSGIPAFKLVSPKLFRIERTYGAQYLPLRTYGPGDLPL
jgi:hypothetical protein